MHSAAGLACGTVEQSALRSRFDVVQRDDWLFATVLRFNFEERQDPATNSIESHHCCMIGRMSLSIECPEP